MWTSGDPAWERITLRAGGRTYEYHSGGSQPPGEPTLDWVLARRKSGQAARAGLRRQDVGEVEVAMEGTPQALIPKLQEPDDSGATVTVHPAPLRVRGAAVDAVAVGLRTVEFE